MNPKIKQITFLLCCSVFVFGFTGTLKAQNDFKVNLVWHTETQTPPAYQGKALPTKNSRVEVIAFIETPNINIGELNFNWYLDREKIDSKSGKGKDRFEFEIQKNARSKQKIKLMMSNPSGGLLKKEILIPIVSPEASVTPNTNQVESNRKLTFEAMPFFFNVKNPNQLKYNWFLGDQEASKKENKEPFKFVLNSKTIEERVNRDLRIKITNKQKNQEANFKSTLTFIP